MKIRLPVLIFTPLIAILIAAWWLLVGVILAHLPFLHGDTAIVAHITLFILPPLSCLETCP